jgi:hypothetical protein
MLVHMNTVWTPQTNIVFSLGRTDPAPIKEIAFDSGGPSRTNPDQAQALTNAKDQSADLTIFFAKSVFDPPIGSHTPWTFAKNGYTDAKDGFCAVADSRLEFTIEHEEGHFLGALDAKGQLEKDFGHSTGGDIMNIDIPSNGIIPLSMPKNSTRGLCEFSLNREVDGSSPPCCRNRFVSHSPLREERKSNICCAPCGLLNRSRNAHGAILRHQYFRTRDVVTCRAQRMNALTAGLSVRFSKYTISAEIRGPEYFSGNILKAA